MTLPPRFELPDDGERPAADEVDPRVLAVRVILVGIACVTALVCLLIVALAGDERCGSSPTAASDPIGDQLDASSPVPAATNTQPDAVEHLDPRFWCFGPGGEATPRQDVPNLRGGPPMPAWLAECAQEPRAPWGELLDWRQVSAVQMSRARAAGWEPSR